MRIDVGANLLMRGYEFERKRARFHKRDIKAVAGPSV
jgi:hypothetical protein